MLNLPANFETYAEAPQIRLYEDERNQRQWRPYRGCLLLFCSSGTSDGCRCLPLRLYALPAMNRFLPAETKLPRNLLSA